jgi:hypothetical protein
MTTATEIREVIDNSELDHEDPERLSLYIDSIYTHLGIEAIAEQLEELAEEERENYVGEYPDTGEFVFTIIEQLDLPEYPSWIKIDYYGSWDDLSMDYFTAFNSGFSYYFWRSV